MACRECHQPFKSIGNLRDELRTNCVFCNQELHNTRECLGVNEDTIAGIAEGIVVAVCKSCRPKPADDRKMTAFSNAINAIKEISEEIEKLAGMSERVKAIEKILKTRNDLRLASENLQDEWKNENLIGEKNGKLNDCELVKGNLKENSIENALIDTKMEPQNDEIMEKFGVENRYEILGENELISKGELEKKKVKKKKRKKKIYSTDDNDNKNSSDGIKCTDDVNSSEIEDEECNSKTEKRSEIMETAIDSGMNASSSNNMKNIKQKITRQEQNTVTSDYATFSDGSNDNSTCECQCSGGRQSYRDGKFKFKKLVLKFSKVDVFQKMINAIVKVNDIEIDAIEAIMVE